MSSASSRLSCRLSGTSPLTIRERQPLGDRRLADAGLADQHRVVLGPPRQHLHRPPDLLVAADDRVDLALARRLGQVARILLQRVIALLGARGVRGPALADVVDRRVQPLRRDARPTSAMSFAPDLVTASAVSIRSTVTKLSPACLRELLRLGQHLRGLPVHVELVAAALDPRHLGERRVDRRQRLPGSPPARADQVRRQPLVVVEQRLQQMLRQEPLVVLADARSSAPPARTRAPAPRTSRNPCDLTPFRHLPPGARLRGALPREASAAR